MSKRNGQKVGNKLIHPQDQDDLKKLTTLNSPKLVKPSEYSTQTSFEEYEIDFDSENENEEKYPKEIMKILKRADSTAFENFKILGPYKLTEGNFN